MATTIQIDPEFRALIPPLTVDELQQLTDNLLRDGCRDKLVVWQGVLLDGHNRFAICEKHSLPCETVEQACADRDAAKVWIIQHQLGRRNLQPYQRIELAVVLKPLVAAEAKARQVAGGHEKVSVISRKAVHTNVELAKIAGVSEQTVHRALAIQEHAPEEVKVALRQGKTTINRAYKNLDKKKGAKPKKNAKPKATSTPPRSPIAKGERVQAEIRERIKLAEGAPRTVKDLTQRWDVVKDTVLGYLREVMIFGGVIDHGDGTYTFREPSADAQVQELLLQIDALKQEASAVKQAAAARAAAFLLKLEAGRKEARDGYNGWRMDNVHTMKQSKVLDWVVDEIRSVVDELKTTPL